MKKIILIVCMLLMLGSASAGMSESLFCMIDRENVTISLKQSTGYYSCKTTIASLEKMIISSAADLMNIQSYIRRNQDVSYRKPIQKDKIAKFNQLQSIRISIISNMKSFESNLLKKTIELFMIKVLPYKFQLQRSLSKISAFSGSSLSLSVQKYRDLLTGQLATIDSFSGISTLDSLIPVLTKYVYLKQQILGKSE